MEEDLNDQKVNSMKGSEEAYFQPHRFANTKAETSLAFTKNRTFKSPVDGAYKLGSRWWERKLKRMDIWGL